MILKVDTDNNVDYSDKNVNYDNAKYNHNHINKNSKLMGYMAIANPREN